MMPLEQSQAHVTIDKSSMLVREDKASATDLNNLNRGFGLCSNGSNILLFRKVESCMGDDITRICDMRV